VAISIPSTPMSSSLEAPSTGNASSMAFSGWQS
jgi:hypothetical protein